MLTPQTLRFFILDEDGNYVIANDASSDFVVAEKFILITLIYLDILLPIPLPAKLSLPLTKAITMPMNVIKEATFNEFALTNKVNILNMDLVNNLAITTLIGDY